MPFLYNKIQHRGREGLEITGYDGTAKKLQIPSEIDGLPVVSIGKHAFSDGNKGLAEVWLPDSIEVIKAFAFYFCSELHRIVLSDSVTDYYDGAIRTSAGINDIEINMDSAHSELAHRILEDSDRKMRVTFCFRDMNDSRLRLVFPAYNSNSIEDTRAQTFHIRIEGSGFSYRECVRQDGIRIKEYDSLYRKALADNPEVSTEIAVGRLMYPTWLSEADADNYREHIRKDIYRAIELASEPENEGWIELFIKEELLDEAALDHVLKTASEHKQTELVGKLMDYRRSRFKPRTDNVLSLDELDFEL